MPYMLVGNCVHKKNEDGTAGETVPGGCHKTPEEAKKHMTALYANVHDSAIVEFSLVITKAAFDKSEPDPNRKRRILMTSSDVEPDLYDERMSVDLFKDFVSHIENNDSIPEPFNSVICEDSWCGGMPYLSIAHYKSGTGGKNLPGVIESVYIDGKQLKSKAFLNDSPLGRALFDSLCDDDTKRKSGVADHKPVRVSIGFLDTEHVHETQGKSVTFTRTGLGQICPLCEQNIGGKIYKKGYLVHEATTRVPVNRRTGVSLEEKSMGDIITKHDDAASIIGEELAKELEQKSLADDILVVKAEGTEVVNTPVPEPFVDCYDPNTDSLDQNCINRKMMQYMVEMRNAMHTVKSDTVDEVVEEAERREDVSDADKKRAKKEYGDVKYADETNNKYPIDTEEHIRAAWNYIHQKRNAAKYSSAEVATIEKKIVAAWKRVIGGEPPSVEKSEVVEESMDKKDMDKEHEDMESKDDEAKEEAKKSEVVAVTLLDEKFNALKSMLAEGKSVAEVQALFNELGSEVEKSLKPADAPAITTDIASIVKSAVEAAVAPLRVDLATIKAERGQSVAKSAVPMSRALTLKPNELIQNSVPAEGQQQLSQIQQIARRSVYGS